MAGVVDVERRPAEDHHDLVDGGVAFTPGTGVIAPGSGVRNVGRRWYPVESVELRAPGPVSRQSPKCDQGPIDGGVSPIALLKGELAGDVVDKGQPMERKAAGEGNDREHLRQNRITTKS